MLINYVVYAVFGGNLQEKPSWIQLIKYWYSMVMKFIDKLFGKKSILNKTDWLFLGGGLVAFASLALLNIARRSIWFDEAYGAYLMRYDFSEIARFTANDVHPPLYYWLLKVWQDLFGFT